MMHAMRRTALIAVSVVLAFAGMAAAASYKTGTYKAGSATKDGVSLRIGQGKFSVSRISFRETCTSSSDSFSERFTFVEGTEAKLKGKINSKWHLKGRYESSAGTVTITGTVKGSKATVK